MGKVGKTVPFRADFLRNPSDLLCELTQFIDHGVDDVLELDHDYALDDDGDFLAEVTPCDCVADSCDILHLVFKKLQLLDLFSKTLQLLPLRSKVNELVFRRCERDGFQSRRRR